MKRKKTINNPKTLTVSNKTWSALTQLKLDGGYETIDEVLRVLLGEKS